MFDIQKIHSLSQLLRSTVRIEVEEDNPSSVGIGTSAIIEDSGKVMLITNKHVIENSKIGRMQFHIRHETETETVLWKQSTIELDDFEARWKYHPDPNIDLAMLPLYDFQHDIEKQLNTGDQLYICPITTSQFPTPNINRYYFDVAEELLFVGYPNNIYDEKNNIPIIRRGIAATPINVDYNGRPEFLIDASVFPGSSGSPVFRCKYIEEDRQRQILSRTISIYFLGIISSVFYRTEDYKVESVKIPTKTSQIVLAREMIDLGVVIKSKMMTTQAHLY